MRRSLCQVSACGLLVAAALPARPSPAEGPSAAEPVYSASDRDHWSFHPLAVVAPPRFEQGEDRAWVRTPIDAFILDALAKTPSANSPLSLWERGRG